MSDAAKTKATICPNCQRTFRYNPRDEPSYLPFCCERCQWIDLGRWLTGEYCVSRDILADDAEQDD